MEITAKPTGIVKSPNRAWRGPGEADTNPYLPPIGQWSLALENQVRLDGRYLSKIAHPPANTSTTV